MLHHSEMQRCYAKMFVINAAFCAAHMLLLHRHGHHLQMPVSCPCYVSQPGMLLYESFSSLQAYWSRVAFS